jgi:hypothetical protein
MDLADFPGVKNLFRFLVDVRSWRSGGYERMERSAYVYVILSATDGAQIHTEEELQMNADAR